MFSLNILEFIIIALVKMFINDISTKKVTYENHIVNTFTKHPKQEPFNLLRLGLGLMEPTL